MKKVIIQIFLLFFVIVNYAQPGIIKTEVKIVNMSDDKITIVENESLNNAVKRYGEEKALKAWNDGEAHIATDDDIVYNRWGLLKRKEVINTFLIKTIDTETNEHVLIRKPVVNSGEWQYSFKIWFFWIILFITGILTPKWKPLLSVRENKDIINIHIFNMFGIMIVFFVSLPFSFLIGPGADAVTLLGIVIAVLSFFLGMFFAPYIVLLISLIWLVFVPLKLFVIVISIMLLILSWRIGNKCDPFSLKEIEDDEKESEDSKFVTKGGVNYL